MGNYYVKGSKCSDCIKTTNCLVRRIVGVKHPHARHRGDSRTLLRMWHIPRGCAISRLSSYVALLVQSP